MERPQRSEAQPFSATLLVIPAKAGIQLLALLGAVQRSWIPAFAGMTTEE